MVSLFDRCILVEGLLMKMYYLEWHLFLTAMPYIYSIISINMGICCHFMYFLFTKEINRSGSGGRTVITQWCSGGRQKSTCWGATIQSDNKEMPCHVGPTWQEKMIAWKRLADQLGVDVQSHPHFSTKRLRKDLGKLTQENIGSRGRLGFHSMQRWDRWECN